MQWLEHFAPDGRMHFSSCLHDHQRVLEVELEVVVIVLKLCFVLFFNALKRFSQLCKLKCV